MITTKITADQLHCPECVTVIPRGQTKCPNPGCRTNKPIHGDTIIKLFQIKQY